MEFCAEEQGFLPLRFHENVSEGADAKGWKLSCYDDGRWKGVSPVAQVPDILSADNLKPRPIPFIRRVLGGFVNLPASPIRFPAHMEQSMVLDAGEKMTGFIRLNLIGGAGASVELMDSAPFVRVIGDASRVSTIPTRCTGAITQPWISEPMTTGWIEGVRNPDYKVLAQIMLETEPDLFSDAHPCLCTPCIFVDANGSLANRKACGAALPHRRFFFWLRRSFRGTVQAKS